MLLLFALLLYELAASRPTGGLQDQQEEAQTAGGHLRSPQAAGVPPARGRSAQHPPVLIGA